MTNLREKDRDTICRLADSCIKRPVEIWAYGSRVNGDSHESSDLDLVIRTSDLKPLDSNTLMNFNERIRESNIPIIVQVFDWAKLSDSFRNNIASNYEVIYSSLLIEHLK